MIRVAIVGCGLIGRKRADALPPGALRIACDVDPQRASELAAPRGVEASSDWLDTIERSDVDAVIIATTHDQLAPVALEAVRRGKHVLVEKPGARRAAELEPVTTSLGKAVVRVGFNHRYHPALQKARALIDADAIGRPQYVRARYGHGGRPGYDREWRAVPEISGGGEAIDQGMHLIDLARWFLGDFTRVHGSVATYFWDMPVEDNAFMLLRTADGGTAQLHASWTEWKNLFSFELTGRLGKIEISGLGGSYGVERLTYYRMLPEMGPPETTSWEYPFQDASWRLETQSWLDDIAYGAARGASIRDAQAALQIIESVYAEAG